MIPKGDPVGENKETRKSYTHYGRNVASFVDREVDIFCYRGNLSTPGWMDDNPCKFLPMSRILVPTVFQRLLLKFAQFAGI